MDLINILCMTTSVILFFVTCFVVKPLTTNIENIKDTMNANVDGLNITINKLNDVVEILRNAATINRVEIAKIDESVKSAHKRLDVISNQIHELETRCMHCNCKKE